MVSKTSTCKKMYNYFYFSYWEKTDMVLGKWSLFSIGYRAENSAPREGQKMSRPLV